jgi:hypothetical protein
MHPIATVRHWSHDLHDGTLTMWHHIDDHLRSRHFWAGVGIALLVTGIAMLLIILAKNAPLEFQGEVPYGIPYAPYR